MPVIGEVVDESKKKKTPQIGEVQTEDRNSASNLGRQAVASVLDVPGGMVSLGGLVQAGIDQLFSNTRPSRAAERYSIGTETHEPEQKKPFSASLDNTMTHVGAQMRQGVNDIMRVKEPETTMEHVARILPGAMIPAGEVASGSKALDTLSSVILPFAQTTAKASLPVKIGQVVAQGGAVVAADQAIRAGLEPTTKVGDVQNDPYASGRYKKDNHLEWLVGLGLLAGGSAVAYRAAMPRSPLDPTVVGYLARRDTQPGSMMKNTPMDQGVPSVGNQVYAQAVDRRSAVPDTMRASGVDKDVVDDVEGIMNKDANRQAAGSLHDGILPETGKTMPSYSRDIEAPYQALDETQRGIFDNGMIAIREKLNRVSATFNKVAGNAENLSAYAYKEIKFHTRSRDKALKRVDKLGKEMDATDDELKLAGIERKLKNENDRIVYAQKKIDDWQTAGDTGVVIGQSGKKYDLNEYWTNGKTAKEMNEFLTDTVGGYRIKTGLLIGSKMAANDALDASILALRRSPQLLKMAQDYGKITQGLLQHGVDEGVWSAEISRKMKDLMTLDDLGPMYIPGREALPDLAMPQRLMRTFGITTTGARDVARDIIGNMNMRAVDAGKGILKPMTPTEVIHGYAAAVFNHIQKSKMQAKTVDAMSNALAKLHTENKALKAAGAVETPIGVDVRKLGERDDVHGGSGIDEKSADVKALRAAGIDIEKNMITIQRNGKLEQWYISDKSFRDVLEMSPRVVEGFDAVGLVVKNAFTTGTTRNILFAPKQFLYSMFQIGVNSMAHGVGFNPITAIKGFAHSASTNILRETGAILRRNLVERTVMGKTNGAWVENLAGWVERHVADSFYDKFNRETGGLHSTYQTRDTNRFMPDLTKQLGGMYRDPGAWPVIWRYTNALSNALHDGPMLGLQMNLAGKRAKSLQKTVKDLTGHDMDAVNVQSKQIGGDFRAVGSGKTADTIANYVPWSGAIINSLASFGRAAKKNPVGFAAGITSWIVAPTAMEYLMTFWFGSDEQKKAYSTQYSDNTMSSNFIVPTGDPNAPELIPLPPEGAIFRAATLAMIDGLIGYTNDYREMPSFSPNMGDGLNLSQPLPGHAEAFEEQKKKDYKHMMSLALARFFNIPIPPGLQAAAAFTGNMLYAGPPTDMEAPAMGNIRPLGGTEKISGMDQGQSRFPDSPFTREMEGAMNALAGFFGSLVVGMSNAFDQGARSDLGTAIGGALAEGGHEIAQFVGITNPLTGDATRPTANDATEQKVRAKTNGLEGLVKEFNNRRTQGSVMNTKTMENYPGDAAFPEYSPLMYQISMKVASYADKNKNFEQLVSGAQKLRIDILGSTFITSAMTRNETLNGLLGDQLKKGEPLSPTIKRKMEDALTWEIKSYRELMYANLLQTEKDVQSYLDQSGYQGKPFKLEDAGSIAASVRQLAPTPEASPLP